MPRDLRLGLRLTADGKGFVGEVRVSKKALDDLTGSTKGLSPHGRGNPGGCRTYRPGGGSIPARAGEPGW